MYRSVLALLFASVLLLSGCAVGQKNMPLSGGRLLLGHGTADAVHPRRYRRRERLCQRHLRDGRRLQVRLQGRDRLSGNGARGV